MPRRCSISACPIWMASICAVICVAMALRPPILMLTARAALQDRLDGFAVGADDYLPKPFAFDELLARLGVLIRRGGEAKPTPLRFAGLLLDPATKTARMGSTSLPLSRREFDLLAALVSGGGSVVSREALSDAVWGTETSVTDKRARRVYRLSAPRPRRHRRRTPRSKRCAAAATG